MRAAAALLLAGAAACGLAATPSGGDPARGEKAFAKCYACHDLAPGKNVAGPSLAGIVGARVAAAPGFEYSRALVALSRTEDRWSEALLDAFLADPEAVAPGTSMTFTGMRDPRERADLIAYLRGSSPS